MAMKKATRKNKPGAGRPHRSLDEERIGQMAFNGCKNSEIANILGCDDETLKNNYSLILDKKRAERREALRAKQTERALKGDIPMLIFLGKNELDQTDKQIQEIPGVEAALYEISEKFLPKVANRGHEK
ncbi:MAG: hypothetical protein M0R06_13650 [Sphaerochaeta sp.]|jgi:hypothetical protein|nr:hypothetical protein [Sphaerochaeta sp.]